MGFHAEKETICRIQSRAGWKALIFGLWVFAQPARQSEACLTGCHKSLMFKVKLATFTNLSCNVQREDFMADNQTYECENCGKKATTAADQNRPECCGQPMKEAEPLPACELSETAEHSRLGEDSFGEACDDGRSGKI
ncbi:MAG: hypothetical protein JSW39_24165 [Desulfobacterales bacterium]|nr:MAG: hypothetical protein JSW39_24165 [Desulfobacterales bacterium]